MPKAVEGYRFRYPCLFEPAFQRIINHTPFQLLEYFACSGRTA